MFVGWLPLISAENYADICDTVSGRYVNICQWRVQHFFNASIHLLSHENSVFRNSLVNQAAALLEPLVRMSSCIFHCSAIYCHLSEASRFIMSKYSFKNLDEKQKTAEKLKIWRFMFCHFVQTFFHIYIFCSKLILGSVEEFYIPEV